MAAASRKKAWWIPVKTDADYTLYQLWVTMGIWYAEDLRSELAARHGPYPNSHLILEDWERFRAVVSAFLKSEDDSLESRPPTLRTTDHETLPQLIEAGDLELLTMLRDAGHFLPMNQADELGLTPVYYAVAFCQPEVLRWLDSLEEVDIHGYCDDDGYGTAAFYAASDGIAVMLETLARLGIDLDVPCTKLGDRPVNLIERLEVPEIRDLCHLARTLRTRSATTATRALFMIPKRKRFLDLRRKIVLIQRHYAMRCSTRSLVAQALEDREDRRVAVKKQEAEERELRQQAAAADAAKEAAAAPAPAPGAPNDDDGDIVLPQDDNPPPAPLEGPPPEDVPQQDAAKKEEDPAA